MRERLYLPVIGAIIATALVKLAFFPASRPGTGLVTPAHAGSLIEWDDSRRIVTTNEDGSVTYVWDYDTRTRVRRYRIEGDRLVLETFELGELNQK